jgi:SAM-dependent methyltransferase
LDIITKKVRAFYETYSFPGYEEFESVYTLREKARRGMYAQLLDEQIPFRVNVLDVGCGTGQLVAFLSLAQRKVIGLDLSFESLRKANAFALNHQMKRVAFAQANIFQIPFRDSTFDFVICNGVLHHTKDARSGFSVLCDLLKPQGYLVVGLYNKYGRLLMDIRRSIFALTGDRLKWLDYSWRRRFSDPEKREVWFMDQYRNPHETRHTVGEVLTWFKENDIEFLNSVPKITLTEDFTVSEKLFEPHDRGTRIEHVLRQLSWIFTKGREGGFFLMVGRKRT